MVGGEVKKCYGRYHSSRHACGECAYVPWCKEAGDLKVDKNLKQLSSVIFDPAYAAMPEVYDEEEDSMRNEVNGALAEFIAGIHNLDIDKKLKEGTAKKALDIFERICSFPEMTRMITLEKFIHPELSYRRIGDKFGMRKQSVAKHLERAIRKIPELRKALIIDSRFLTKKLKERVNSQTHDIA